MRVAAATLVVPAQAALAVRYPADAAAARRQIVERLFGRHFQLVAEPLRHDGDVDEAQQLMRVDADAAAVERGENAGLTAGARVVEGSVGLVTIDVERPTAGDIEGGEWVQMFVVACAQDRTLPGVRHHE